MKKGISVIGMAVGVLVAATAWAHHSFAAEYDENKPVTLRGTLKEVQLTNPHGWIYIEVKETDGKVVEWRIETGPTNSMMRGGLRKTDFIVGTEVLVKGFRAKNGSPTANGRSIIMADGRDYGLGSNAPAAGNTQ